MKVLHTADLHLRIEGDDRWRSLSRVLDTATAEIAQLVVISGDLFDRGQEVARLKPALRDLFEARPYRVLILPGNHDVQALSDSDYFGENVDVISRNDLFYDLDDVRVFGLPFDNVSGDRVLERIRSVSDNRREGACNILLYHGELLDLFYRRVDFGDEDASGYMPMRLSFLDDSGIDYVLAGHFHSRFVVNRYRGGYFVYPGSPVSITIKETGPRRVNLFETGSEPHGFVVDTPYYEEATITLSPFDEAHPLDIVRERVAACGDNARLLIQVDGLVDLSRLGMTEAAFADELKRITMTQNVENAKVHHWRDVAAVLNSDLFTRCMGRLDARDLDPQRRERVKQYLVESIGEAIDAN